MIEKFNEIANLIDLFSNAIPEGTSEKLDLDGFSIHLSKEGGKVNLSIHENEENLQDAVQEFKSNIEALDDDLFIEVIKEIKENIDLKRFDELLNSNSYKNDEVLKTIDYVSKVIAEHIQKEIDRLEELKNRF